MKSAPNLHPTFLLIGMSTVPIPTPPIAAKLDFCLVGEGYEFHLGNDGAALQIQLKDAAAINELRAALNRLLNVGDLSQPRWLWQLDALLDPTARQLYLGAPHDDTGR